MHRSVRVRRNTVRAAIAAAAITSTTACPLPEPAPPTMPAGVGIEWVRDVGGAPDEFGEYEEDYGRFRLLDGVRTGPTSVEPNFYPLTPTNGSSYAQFDVPVFPDGTAKFGWNGFAGDGITTDVSSQDGATTYAVTGPGGTCSFTNEPSMGFPMPRTTAAIPSPDGSKLAVFTRLANFDSNTITTWLSLHQLDDACAQVTSASYSWNGNFGNPIGERIASSLVVWSPTSAAVLFPLDSATDGSKVLRLDATDGAVATTAYWPDGATVVPLGWSGDRMLVVNSTAGGGRDIRIVPIGGGTGTLVDRWTGEYPLTEEASHYGYFVPGTRKVVYADATRTAVNAQSETVAWPRFRLFDDATGGFANLTGTDSPLQWHETFDGDRPNVEYLDRFVS